MNAAQKTLTAVMGGTLLALSLAGVAGATTPDGAQTRPDYAGLGDCAPKVWTTADGDFDFEVVCPGQRWMLATYHVPHTGDRFLDDQVPTQTEEVTSVGRVTRSFTVTGPCAQQDVWLAGQDQPYSAWTLDNGVCDAAPAPRSDLPTPVRPTVPDAPTQPATTVAPQPESAPPHYDEVVYRPTSPAPYVGVAVSPATLPATGSRWWLPWVTAAGAGAVAAGSGCMVPSWRRRRKVTA